MNKSLLTLALIAIAGSVVASTTLNATHDYVVETTGTFSQDGSFLNFGVAGGSFKSFAALDFDATALAPSTVTSATLNLTESVFGSTSPNFITIWAVTNNTVDLSKPANGATGIVYDTTVVGGLNGQLGTATQLGTLNFTSTSTTTPTNQVDSIALTGLSALTALVNSGAHNVRIVLTSNETGEATFAAAGTTTSTPPQLVLNTQAVPEPASMAVLGLGVVALVRRRKASK
jgi:hypothetical protein